MVQNENVTVIGLGKMGLKLVDLLKESNYQVTVWNRTAQKAKGLAGVIARESIDEAIAASEVIVICVLDHEAVTSVLNDVTNKQLLSEKTFINFTTGSPQEADNLEKWLNENGAAFINGALQVAPDQMGKPETTILLSGKKDVYEAEEHTLKLFGGNLKYLGDKALLASAMDLATLSWLYGSYIGMLHGVALCQRSGIELELYKDILAEITPGFMEFFQHQIGVIESGDFRISQSPLSISVGATSRLHEVARDYKLNTNFLSVISNYLKEAEQMGLGNKEAASLIKIVNGSGVKTEESAITMVEAPNLS